MPIRKDVSARTTDAPRPSAWMIDYEDGTYPTEFTNPDQFSHEDGEPWEAPGTGVLLATYTDEAGNRIERSDELYYVYLREAGTNRAEGAFVGGDDAGVRERMLAGESIVVFSGRYVPDAEFLDRRLAARLDRRFPASLEDESEMTRILQEAAADTGPNRYQIMMQAIFHARTLGFPHDPFIDDIMKIPLKNALNSGG